ncbi:bifunctional phosphoribosyl-AMP cyclohydrolase/phosphoribosyl-ATP diphosphatase HisIE [Pontibacillus sp. ALD_SL1]|uniref:bifunctional phosphoribosyl-AMP cyclohydrolase/phosphoribosyl-ATP diphosphatase HisIE n=1 Tax=Pontibacillus sp. ALD_SL1 TaxID=2777185 RepID=UPI001A96123A|nr:bifunctional phosphoribosyl-AMP cyclohydrolase/phosphoribosyl-ATP diphosphatase HisIE [Pontibacillus sp. ALD_SL1]QSS99559.1 bifunctional phosphoribosyl-AMP cyclohydrolase/phosphoribosyl-ATP diphosphatase HisIE [Pontibacillus sp. ALD_SL1]
MNVDTIQFDEKGLVPAIIQDARSKEVLTLAYMNEEAVKKSVESGETHLYSRSRQELWHKGATSGNTQFIETMKYDCDQDAVLLQVIPQGPACHKGDYSCFSETVYGKDTESKNHRYQILDDLQSTLAERLATLPEGSYASQLFQEGVDRILKKVGEEAGEVIIAAKNNDAEELTWETADLLFHTLMLLTERGVPFDDVLGALEGRRSKK